jgi:hypothetical protein
MTGQSADQLQQNQAEAQQVEAYNAKLASMKPAEAAKYQAAFDTLRATSKTAAMGFAASVTGMTGLTEDSSKAFQMPALTIQSSVHHSQAFTRTPTVHETWAMCGTIKSSLHTLTFWWQNCAG